jgi:uncharacterized protein YqeY
VSVLREQLSDELKIANDVDDKCAIAVIRLIQAALEERDIRARESGHPDGLSDEDVAELLKVMVTQRCDSSRRYEASGQLDLAAREQHEIEVIERLLPEQLDEGACEKAVKQVIGDLGVHKVKETGRVINELKSRYPGQMNFAKARRMVCRELG